LQGKRGFIGKSKGIRCFSQAHSLVVGIIRL